MVTLFICLFIGTVSPTVVTGVEDREQYARSYIKVQKSKRRKEREGRSFLVFSFSYMFVCATIDSGKPPTKRGQAGDDW